MTPIHGTGGTSTSSRASSTVTMGQKERVNGWSCPWHPLQFTAWFFLLSFAVAYYGISVSYLPKEWRAAGYIIAGGVYVIHVVYHLLALTVNPADANIQGGTVKEKATFDRSQHRHVIENNHCYICQSQVGPRSKHCSVCNKCVSGFDHHCKWLNNCVGDRNYKLFIGCVGSAFVEGLLVFVAQLYLCITYFKEREVLKERVGGDFQLFVPVSDVVFIVFMGIIAALLLISLALLGHLLGFHIYLMCHKMTTYEFIVNARDGQRKHTSDVEASTRPSTARRVMKNKVMPEASRESLENERVELSERERSVASSQVLHSETTVKIISEVSSKAAARHQSGTELPEESVQPANSVELGALNSSHAAKETQSATSEESLKEVCAQPAPSGDTSASTALTQKENSLLCSRDNGDLDGSSGEEELLPCPQGQNLRKNRNSSAVPDSKNVGNSKGNKNNHVTQGHDNRDSNEAAPRKKKKKKPKEAAKKSEELPPLNVRSGRPLPVLRLQNNEDSAC